ncbi:hypothetical protein VNO80_14848 [Phaseolus coccineus]|uniref:Uncharacterized protein n=1 Tax=Phaseolus coccineus TaxID=3886 RepID=A0AAN9MNV8_PHACN
MALPRDFLDFAVRLYGICRMGFVVRPLGLCRKTSWAGICPETSRALLRDFLAFSRKFLGFISRLLVLCLKTSCILPREFLLFAPRFLGLFPKTSWLFPETLGFTPRLLGLCPETSWLSLRLPRFCLETSLALPRDFLCFAPQLPALYSKTSRALS